jgi:hypothetical protein
MAGWLASVSVQLYTPFLRVLLTGHRTAVNNLIWIFTICFYCEKGQGKSKKKSHGGVRWKWYAAARALHFTLYSSRSNAAGRVPHVRDALKKRFVLPHETCTPIREYSRGPGCRCQGIFTRLQKTQNFVVRERNWDKLKRDTMAKAHHTTNAVYDDTSNNLNICKFSNFKNGLTEDLLINVIHELWRLFMVRRHILLVPQNRLIAQSHADHRKLIFFIQGKL